MLEFWRKVFKAMSPSDRLRWRIIGSLALGVFVALANLFLDISVSRRDGAHATNALNEFIIGVTAALLGYVWVSHRDATHELELSTERRMQEAVHEERKRIALEIHDTVGQAHAGAILHLELASDFLAPNQTAREHVRRALQLICGSMTEMRCALWDLYPEELQKLDLRGAIECLVNDLTTNSGLKGALCRGWLAPPASFGNRKGFAKSLPGSPIECCQACSGARGENSVVL